MLEDLACDVWHMTFMCKVSTPGGLIFMPVSGHGTILSMALQQDLGNTDALAQKRY